MPASNLPARPNQSQYRKQAKELLKAFRANEPRAIQRVRHSLPSKEKLTLADAQFVIAREYGFDSWSQFIAEIRRGSADIPVSIWTEAASAVVTGDADTLKRLLQEHDVIFRNHEPQSSWPGGLAPDYSSGDARTIIARSHEFDDWEQFAAFTKALKTNESVADFEKAVDAIVTGNADALERLIRKNRDIVRMRSMRRHGSTLLHYVGANGVEGFRQRTPANAVQIATILLESGSEIDAAADMYDGACTALDLIATSIHPRRAGVQNALIDLMLASGSKVDRLGHLLINDCLANGRGDAAAHLAQRGLPLDLEAAAGLGRLDIVESLFDDDGNLKPAATAEQMRDGFTWACEYGHTAVVEFLLDRGQNVAEVLPRPHGQTGLHWAAHGGHLDTVNTLLERQAPIDVRDATFEGTPLGWALVGFSTQKSDGATPDESFYDVVAALIEAGAHVEPGWIEPDKAKTDARMYAILTGGKA